MKIVILGNDLRALSLERKLLSEGQHVFVFPGYESPFPLAGSVARAHWNAPCAYYSWEAMYQEEELTSFVQLIEPDLVVCLHIETSLAGIVDELRHRGYPVFGLSEQAVRIESSKMLGLQFAQKVGLSIPYFEIIRPSKRQAWLSCQQHSGMCVIKEDGLAGGKGSHILDALELPNHLSAIDEDTTLIYQEYLAGYEVALSLLCGDQKILPLNINLEYKRALEGDQGLNTSGMGTIARNTANLHSASTDAIVEILEHLPTGLAEFQYYGPLDINFMIVPGRPKPVFLEFTTRFGDPELSSEILLLENVSETLIHLAHNQLKVYPSRFDWAAGVVSHNGKDSFLKSSQVIQDSLYKGGALETCYSASGDGLEQILESIYCSIASSINNKEAIFRKDIGFLADDRFQAFEYFVPELKLGKGNYQ